MIKIKIIKLLLLFVLLLIVYVLAHIGVYLGLVNFFGITGRATVFLTEALIFLGGSFFLATALSHFRDNIFTRVYYFLAAFWLGVGVNLNLFFLLGWVLAVLNPAMPKMIIGVAAILAAIAYSIYGAWNAFTPRVKKLNIKLPNLPKTWVGKKIVLISDAHLGNIFTERYAHDLAAKINSLKPEMILISGDLFDGTDERLVTFVAPLKKLKAAKGVFYATGNHETYLEEGIASIISKTKINLLRDEMAIVDGLQIIGIDYPKRAQSKNIGRVIKKLSKFDRNKPSILLWHTPNQIETAKKLGISLQLSGHTHKGQLFPFGLVSRIVYGKYDYGLRQDGSFSIYTSSGLGGWGPPMRTEKISEIVQIELK